MSKWTPVRALLLIDTALVASAEPADTMEAVRVVKIGQLQITSFSTQLHSPMLFTLLLLWGDEGSEEKCLLTAGAALTRKHTPTSSTYANTLPAFPE